MDTKELVKQLNQAANRAASLGQPAMGDMMREAADRLEELKSEIDDLENEIAWRDLGS